MYQLLFFILCLVWGTSFILMTKAALAFGPLGIGAWRSVCGALGVMALWLPQRRAWPLGRADLKPLIVVAVLGYALPFFLQPLAIPHIGSATMAMMMCLLPLFTVVASIPMLRTYPTGRQLTGVIGGLVLMAVLMRGARQHGAPVGYLIAAVIVPISYAIAYTLVKQRFAETAAMPLTAAALALAVVPLLPLSLVCERINVANRLPFAVGALATLGFLGTGVANYIFYRLIQARGPLHAGMSMYVIPLVATAWGWLDHETITPTQVILLLGVLAMVGVVQWPTGTPQPVPAQVGMELPPD